MVMGTKKDGRLLFEVPFTPMRTEREAPTHTSSPFIECQIGFGENSSAGRKAAAVKLVNRLLDLKTKGEIAHWQDVAILFRSTSVFGVYEDALEKAGIPYVTVAGRGFYDRPEIRDILNILRALADPWDDLAMTGLLRSPAVGMSDLGIYQLRWGEENEKLSLSKAVKEQRWSVLNETDTAAGKRAKDLLEEITPLIGRVPVVEIIQQVLSLTCYRAVLAGREERVWRNVDKLLQDSYAAQLTSIHAYLEILERLKGSDAREGEAPGEVGEAVQLMTIHKAKGLEFPVLVLGDMGRQDHVFRDAWLPLGDTAVACKGDVQEYEPLFFRLAKQIEKDQTSAEEKRLFYVATTRVKDKLILNGHCSQSKTKYTARGWLKTVLSVLEVEPDEVVKYLSGKNIPLPDGEMVWVEASDLFVINQTGLMDKPTPLKQAEIGTLYQPLSYEQKPQPSSVEKPEKKTRLQPDPNQPAAQAVIGKMLHRVVQFWHFPSQTELETLFHRTALEFGVIDLLPRQAAVKQVKTYLERFQAHPIYKEIDRASERYHEVPYGLMNDPQSDSGRLDILYQLDGQWWIVDFKTDPIQPEIGLQPPSVEAYIRQLSRYRDAVESQLKVKVKARLCFLDYAGSIRLFELEEGALIKSQETI
jgi:ATP-dependent exoDNAse (exonuclease V) beta subunit